MQKTSNKRYCLPNVEIKDYNVLIDFILEEPKETVIDLSQGTVKAF